METNNISSSMLERFNRWIRESITIKLFSIGFLILILLIPSSWIEDVIEEREERASSVFYEIAEGWAGSQTLTGIALVIPYKKKEVINREKFGKEIHEVIERAYFLPQNLDIQGKVSPQVLHRGIFDAAVYTSHLQIKSTFTNPDFKSLNIAEEDVIWDDAYLAIGITDLQGIKDDLVIQIGETPMPTEPSNDLWQPAHKTNNDNQYSQLSTTGIIAKLNWNSKEDFRGDVNFKLNIKGSGSLNVNPVGKTTSVTLAGSWGNPSFEGKFLPDTREVTDTSFTASWKVLYFNRPFPQQWVESIKDFGNTTLGVRLLIPVDQYQKSIRTAKYGILIIILTFVALFMVEITRKIRIHPFQYILIGVALTIYYTLLLSISEHLGYNTAYWIATLSTVSLVSLYASSFLRNSQLVILLTMLMMVFYTFIFVIILQQDYALLIGSIGLFLVVASLMYFSRKINWYKESVG